MSENIVNVENLTKVYKVYDKNIDRLKEVANLSRKKYHSEFFALDNVSLNIRRGETLGIIGKNGSGKSTLLKLITGVLTPTSGVIEVKGKVAALLELGAGFNPNLTGLDNIYLSGTIMGYSKEEMGKRIDDIIEFADIGEFLYQPVKTYSSGMFARLAFAVAVNVEPDILIVDEALSVGDIYFQAKCITKMKQLAKKSTILFVSHSLDVIKSFCTTAILLNEGKVLHKGNVKEVVQLYENMINQEIADMGKTKPLGYFLKEENDVEHDIDNNTMNIDEDPVFLKMANQFRSGTGEAQFIRAELLVNGKQTNIIPFGALVTLRLIAVYYKGVNTKGTVGYMVRNHNGIDIFGMNIYNKAQLVPEMQKGQILETRFTFKNLLSESGKYTISIGLKPKPFEPIYFDNVSMAVVFEVPPIQNNYVPGMIFVENDLEINLIDPE